MAQHEIKYDNDTCYILLRRVRGSYLHLFKASLMKGETDQSKARFGLTALLDKKAHAQEIRIIQGFHDKLEKSLKLGMNRKTQQPNELESSKTCWHDGSEKDDTDGYGDGVMYIRATSQKRPGVVDVDLTPLAEEDGRPYSGCYINVGLTLKAWDNEFGKRITSYFNNVQFVEHGDAFGGSGIKAEDEFGDGTEQVKATAPKSKGKQLPPEDDDTSSDDLF